jgi:hypothetical protein
MSMQEFMGFMSQGLMQEIFIKNFYFWVLM